MRPHPTKMTAERTSTDVVDFERTGKPPLYPRTTIDASGAYRRESTVLRYSSLNKSSKSSLVSFFWPPASSLSTDATRPSLDFSGCPTSRTATAA